jgi:AraC-like DNA-binding protein
MSHSTKSSSSRDYQDILRPVGAMAKDYPDGYVKETHRHDRAQFLYAVTGVLDVMTTEGVWVIPPQRAVWLPPRSDHSVKARGAVSLRTLYVRSDAYPNGLPTSPRLISVSPLLRELVVRAVEMPVDYDEEGAEGRVIRMIFDELRWLPNGPLHLPQPRDSRLSAINTALLANPADKRTLDHWAEQLGTSTRTLARLSRAECGVSFHQWRQQHRVFAALPRLAASQSITTVALELGYDTPGAFAAMFRKFMGTTPSRYFGANSLG